MRSGRAVFGTVDTWLLHKLKNAGNSTHFEPVIERTNASATGLFDPFAMKFSKANMKFFKIKANILPPVVETSYDFGYTHKSFFGVPVKISTMIADQAASLIGNGCFRKMDAKVRYQINLRGSCVLGFYFYFSDNLRNWCFS